MYHCFLRLNSKFIEIINLTFVCIITIYYIIWKACEYMKYVCSANTIKSLQNSSQIIFKPLCYFEHLQQQKSSHSNLSWEFCHIHCYCCCRCCYFVHYEKKLYNAEKITGKGHFLLSQEDIFAWIRSCLLLRYSSKSMICVALFMLL